MTSLDYARENQKRCAAEFLRTGCEGAKLGIHDWFCEEILILQEIENGRREAVAPCRTGRDV